MGHRPRKPLTPSWRRWPRCWTLNAPTWLPCKSSGPPRCWPSCSSASATSCPTSSSPSTQTAAASRVGFLSRLPLAAPVQLHPLAVGLSPVQVGDDDQDPATPPATTGTMGRGALQVTVTAHGHPLTLLTAHLKSKLLTFPGDRFQPRDEAERARFGADALYLRAAQAATLRTHLEQLLDDTAGPWGWWWPGISTTVWTPPPPSCSRAHPARRSARPALPAPMGVMANACGTWPR